MQDRLVQESAEEGELGEWALASGKDWQSKREKTGFCEWAITRLARESAEEREARLRWMQLASHREGDANREQLFKQRSVQMKLRRSHQHFASLSFPKCSTCFPGIQLRSPTTEYTRCFQDKHTPKLYSSQFSHLQMQCEHPRVLTLQMHCSCAKGA